MQMADRVEQEDNGVKEEEKEQIEDCEEKNLEGEQKEGD